MLSLATLKFLAYEFATTRPAKRIPEPDLVMDDPEAVAAFNHAGREDGVLAPTYLFNAAQACSVIGAGDTVLDLGCGPAIQLAMIANLNPDSRFIGIDLSREMLERAAANCPTRGAGNIEFRHGDLTDLQDFGDASIEIGGW